MFCVEPKKSTGRVSWRLEGKLESYKGINLQRIVQCHSRFKFLSCNKDLNKILTISNKRTIYRFYLQKTSWSILRVFWENRRGCIHEFYKESYNIEVWHDKHVGWTSWVGSKWYFKDKIALVSNLIQNMQPSMKSELSFRLQCENTVWLIQHKTFMSTAKNYQESS